MTEELNRNLNDALELIKRREKLLDEINGYLAAEIYLNSPQIAYRDYKRKYVPQAKPWRIAKNVLLFIFIPYFTLMFFAGYIVGYILTTGKYLLKILIPLVTCGAICRQVRKNHYNIYILNDERNREVYRKQMVRRRDLKDQLESLEAFMSNPQNCIIPKEYWHQAQEIAAYIRNGRAKSIGEAIELIGKNIKTLQTQDAK